MLAPGSDNVFINDQPAVRKGDVTTCGGTIADGSGDVFVGGGTVTVREIDDERPWWITALGVAIGVALTLCGKGQMNLSSLKAALPCLLMHMGASLAGTAAGSQIRTTVGNPVNVITGGKVLREEPDFALPGPMALAWARFYSSHDLRDDGLLGRGWSLPYEVSLTQERGADGALSALVFVDGMGRAIAFPPVPPGECHYSTAEGYYLICTEMGQYLVENVDGIFCDFGIPSKGGPAVLRLQRLEDRNGNWHALDYDGDARLVGLRDNCGRRLELHYSAQHARRVASIYLAVGAEAEPSETLVSYRYHANGQLAEVSDRTGRSIRRFAYQHGLMSEHSAPGGLRCLYAWTGSGSDARVSRHWTDDGESYDFQYDLAARVATVVDQLGRRTTLAWNADSQPIRYTDAEGHTWLCEWDERRQLVSHTDPTGATTRFEYDARGRQVLAINALDQIERTEWHERFDLPTAEVDASGARWRYEYDERGNLILATDPAGHATEHAYDARGLPHTVRDARGGYKHIAFDVRALPALYTDCSGKHTRLAYDERGFLASVTDALGNATRYLRDALGRPQAVTAPDGSVERLRYDAHGRNQRGLITRRINPLGHSVLFQYDQAFRLARLVNENGDAYAFAYDRNDNRTIEKGLDGIVRETVFDARGLPVRITDAAGEADALTLRMERDALGRLTARHTRSRTTAYRYDGAGRVLEAAVVSEVAGHRAVHSTIAFGYSKRGELLSETGHMGTTSYSFDELGNRCTTVLPDGRTLNRLHYGSGHLHQLNLDGQLISDFERNDVHQEVARSQGALWTRYGHDRAGRRILAASASAGHADLLRKEWHYDVTGELVEKRHSRQGKLALAYDPVGRITYAAQDGRRELFQWDAAANLVDQSLAGGRVRFNRVEVFEDKRYEYDIHGRVERKRIGRHTEQRYTYDGEHRLVGVETTREGVRQAVHFD